MKAHAVIRAAVLIACGLPLATQGIAKSLDIKEKLPDAVEKTYRSAYPNGKITKLDVTEENGVMVYDIEFDDGPVGMETDISEDGTMLEFTTVILAKDIPKAAMKTVKKAANGAKLGRMERIELSYEIEDAKVVKLAKTETRYAVEMSKGKKKAEIITTPEGKVVEAPEWVPAQ